MATEISPQLEKIIKAQLVKRIFELAEWVCGEQTDGGLTFDAPAIEKIINAIKGDTEIGRLAVEANFWIDDTGALCWGDRELGKAHIITFPEKMFR